MVVASAAVESTSALPNLIFGSIAVLAGIAIIVFRNNVFRSTVRGQDKLIGKRANATYARLQSVVGVVIAGAGIVLMGVVMIGFGVARLLA